MDTSVTQLLRHPMRSVRRGRADSSLFAPDRNVWRVATASRATLLFDAAGYFGALRDAMIRAEHSIHIVGWDIDSRTRLVGPSGQVDDGYPETLGAFLTELVARKPHLSIRLLLWDYAMLYALERERLPALALQWNTPEQVELCLDDEMPFGCSQHQKIVTIDDRIAFSGGLDITIRRWDTPAHDPANPARIDPAGEAYPPFHDMQMLVEGEAATALAELVRRRWSRAACEDLPPVDPAAATPWPPRIVPDFTDCRIGIARTEPGLGDTAPVREVATLFRDMIARAERCIYVENQFLTCLTIADALIARLADKPDLQVLIAAPRTHHTWFEHRTMLQGRIHFRDRIAAAGVADRVRIVYPTVGTQEVMVHAKIMVVDDRWLRVGSANLCNRSMGTDSECDLVVEARSEEERATVARLRNRLIAEHCGTTADAVAEAMRGAEGLLPALDRLDQGETRFMLIEDGVADPDSLGAIAEVADPQNPLIDATPPAGWSRVLMIGGIVAMIALALAAWRFTPLAGYLTQEALQRSLAAGGHWGPLVAMGFFLVLGLVAFPVNVLIAGTAVAFGIWPGLLYAGVGAMISAIATYFVGRKLGTGLLRRVLGPRINRISQTVGKNGIMAVTMVRLMPVAPFTLVNLVAGAMRIRLLDYTLGTALGLLPGLVLMTALGDRLPAIMADPSAKDAIAFGGIVVAWGLVSWGLQRLVRHIRQRRDA